MFTIVPLPVNLVALFNMSLEAET